MGSAKERFEHVRLAVARLHEVQIMIMNDCDEWRPPSVSSRHSTPDPTASAAIRRVDELEGKLKALREEENDLIEIIGESLVIIRAVRDGLGDKYADVIEWRYIDCMSWDYIKDEYDVTRQTCRNWMNIAFDWIDSIGVTRIMAGDLEI